MGEKYTSIKQKLLTLEDGIKFVVSLPQLKHIFNAFFTLQIWTEENYRLNKKLENEFKVESDIVIDID